MTIAHTLDEVLVLDEVADQVTELFNLVAQPTNPFVLGLTGILDELNDLEDCGDPLCAIHGDDEAALNNLFKSLFDEEETN